MTMDISADRTSVPAATPLWLKLIAIPVTIVVLLAGLWFFGGVVAPGYDSSIGFGAAWFVAASLAIRFGLRARPGLKRPVQLTYAATAIVVAGVFAWTTFRDTTVVEDVATGVAASQAQAPSSGGDNVQLASGSFVGLAHGASGTAAVVELRSPSERAGRAGAAKAAAARPARRSRARANGPARAAVRRAFDRAVMQRGVELVRPYREESGRLASDFTALLQSAASVRADEHLSEAVDQIQPIWRRPGEQSDRVVQALPALSVVPRLVHALLDTASSRRH